MEFRVYVTDLIGEPLEIEREVLGDVAEVVALGAESEAELAGRIEDADALMVYHFVNLGCDEGVVEFRTKGALEVRRALMGETLGNVVN